MLQQLVQVVSQRVQQRPFELVGTNLDLFPEPPAGVGELLPRGHQPSPLHRSNPASISASDQPRLGA
jgi:hypothetical protein